MIPYIHHVNEQSVFITHKGPIIYSEFFSAITLLLFSYKNEKETRTKFTNGDPNMTTFAIDARNPKRCTTSSGEFPTYMMYAIPPIYINKAIELFVMIDSYSDEHECNNMCTLFSVASIKHFQT